MIMHMRMIVTTNNLLAQLIATINPVASHTCTFCNSTNHLKHLQ